MNKTPFLQPIIDDDLPHALDVLKQYDKTSYDNLNKILETTRTTDIKATIAIQTMNDTETK